MKTSPGIRSDTPPPHAVPGMGTHGDAQRRNEAPFGTSTLRFALAFGLGVAADPGCIRVLGSAPVVDLRSPPRRRG